MRHTESRLPSRQPFPLFCNSDSTVNFLVGVGIVAVGILLLSLLQWCRQQRKGKPIRKRVGGESKQPNEADSLISSSNTKGQPITRDLNDLPSLSSSDQTRGVRLRPANVQ